MTGKAINLNDLVTLIYIINTVRQLNITSFGQMIISGNLCK